MRNDATFLEGANGTVVINPDNTLTYIPNPGFVGVDTFVYTASDNTGATSTGSVTVTVAARPAQEVVTITKAKFRLAEGKWRIDGTSTDVTPGNSVTARVVRTGDVFGSASFDALGNFTMRFVGSATAALAGDTISVTSTGGATATSAINFDL